MFIWACIQYEILDICLPLLQNCHPLLAFNSMLVKKQAIFTSLNMTMLIICAFN